MGVGELSFVSHDRCMVSQLGNLFRCSLESDESDLVCRRMRRLAGPPVSALHAPICLPVETGYRSASSEEFSFGSEFHAQHQEIWRTGSPRRQYETAQGRWGGPMTAALAWMQLGAGLRGRDYLSQDQPIYFAQQWRVREERKDGMKRI